MKIRYFISVTFALFIVVNSLFAQCGNFTNSISGIYYSSNNCNSIPPSSTATICATYNISLSTGNASYRLGYQLNGVDYYLTGITNVNSGSYSFNHCITFPCSNTITLMIETWSSPNGNGSQCPTYFTPPQTALPVELVNFSVSYDQKNVKLNWAVANEIDIHKYIINKSYDGIIWFSIGEMASRTSKENLKQYIFIDDVTHKIVYYRLSIADFSGKTVNSKIISTNYSNENPYVFPNPSDGIFTLSSNSESLNYEIVNSIGKVVYVDNHKNVDISFLPEGIYYLKLLDENQVIKILKK